MHIDLAGLSDAEAEITSSPVNKMFVILGLVRVV